MWITISNKLYYMRMKMFWILSRQNDHDIVKATNISFKSGKIDNSQ